MSSEKASQENAANGANGAAAAARKRRRRMDPSKQLSEEEKKLHHIQSEHRRREQIRSTFDRLVEIVPNLTDSEKRSELVVIQKTSTYVNELRADNERLIKLARERGIAIPEDWLAS